VQVSATDRELTVLCDGVPVAQHPLLAPGECSVLDAHYPTPPPAGTRPLRARTESERAFLALGTAAEDYLRTAAAAGTARLSERIEEALALAHSRGGEAALAALERATRFARFRFGDLESIADAIRAAPPERAGSTPALAGRDLPAVPARSIDAYRRDERAA